MSIESFLTESPSDGMMAERATSGPQQLKERTVPVRSDGNLASRYIELVSSDGILNIWRFVEPLPLPSFDEDIESSTHPAQTTAFCIQLAAPVDLGSMDAYMHFARIKDTSKAKQAQYQKYYGNENNFLRSINHRFGTKLSLGVLKARFASAKDNRKQKKKGAMSVKIQQIELLGLSTAAAGMNEHEVLVGTFQIPR